MSSTAILSRLSILRGLVKGKSNSAIVNLFNSQVSSSTKRITRLPRFSPFHYFSLCNQLYNFCLFAQLKMGFSGVLGDYLLNPAAYFQCCHSTVQLLLLDYSLFYLLTPRLGVQFLKVSFFFLPFTYRILFIKS